MQQPEAKSVSRATMFQVAMIVRNLEKTMQDYSSLLGLGPYRIMDSDRLGIKVAFVRLGPVQLELIQPVGEDNPRWKVLGDKDVCLHHFGFDVGDMDAEIARFQELGVRVTRRGRVPGVEEFAFLDTAPIAGADFELLQGREQ